MRINELTADVGIDKFIMALRNHIGRAASQKAPANLTWDAVAQMSRSNGFEFAADYETFKAMFDANPIIQNLVKNFNDRGIVLKVPGVSSDEEGKKRSGETSQDAVDKVAASNAEANLGDSIDMKFNELVTEGQYDKELKTYGIDREKVTLYQASQYRKGNKITWDAAAEKFIAHAKAAQPKKVKKARTADNTKPLSARAEANFKQTMRNAAADFQADFGDSEQDLGDVAWDLAGAMMHDPEVETFVRRTLAYNTGQNPNDIDSNLIQEYITDEIYNAGTNEGQVAEISNDLKQRYKEKASKTIKDTTPYTRKGEYRDLAKRLVARRQAGLDKLNKK